MSDKNNKTQSSDLFKVEPSDEPPKERDTTHLGELNEQSHIGHDPVFTLDENDIGGTEQLKIEAAAPYLADEIHKLQPEVENISKLRGDQNLTNQQIEILRKYISLKENEVRDLKEQRRQFQSLLNKISAQNEELLKSHRSTLSELEVVRRREDKLQQEFDRLQQKHEGDLALMKNDLEERLKQNSSYESQFQDLMKKKEEWKEKVKDDLKRIKLKERELENKYELLKRDTQALLDSKDRHTLELKKKNDALELEMEGLEERLRRGASILSGVDSKKRRLIETLRLAISLLEEIDNENTSGAEDTNRKAG